MILKEISLYVEKFSESWFPFIYHVWEFKIQQNISELSSIFYFLTLMPQNYYKYW
jgi:hypothetical protein